MSELARRLAVAAVGIPIAVGVVWVGKLPLAVFLALLAGIGAWEFFRIARASGLDPMDSIGVPAAAALPLYAVLASLDVLRSPGAVATVVFLALFGVALWARGPLGRPIESISVTATGVAYAGGTLAFAYLLRHHRFVVEPRAGAALLFFPVVLTWISDTGAYFVGRWLGRSKLMPSVSPGKTRAGAVGAIAFTVAGAVAYNTLILAPNAKLALAAWSAPMFGVVVSMAGQIGDLVESMLKRQAGVKDSGSLLPGHGGVLDRFDSLYFVLPVAYLVLSRLLLPVA